MHESFWAPDPSTSLVLYEDWCCALWWAASPPPSLNILKLILCVQMSCVHVCLCRIYTHDSCGGLKKGARSLELELYMGVSLQVGAGNRTWVF